ncbi:sulfotransferase 1B1-like [Ornithodoros turicata]|uniref:sulfotransferase 1B1-like n=1 Tax=Ornithodoros turicata TaxID=34597 RepID=UPI0031396375
MSTSKHLHCVFDIEDVKGVLVPPKAFKPDVVADALTYEAAAGDVFLATYPKTGATWTQYIIWTLLNTNDDLPSFFDIMNKHIPFLEMVGKDVIEALPQPRLIKHHLPFSLSPYNPEAKYVVIVRNPFDVVVSYYHHYKDMKSLMCETSKDFTFEDFFEVFLDGKVAFGDYFDHVLSWYDHRNDSNVFFFYYEDLKERPRDIVLQLADFLNAEDGDEFRRHPGLLDEVVRRTAFDNMKGRIVIDQDVHGVEADADKTNAPLRNFFRKGVIGDWRNYLNAEQKNRLRKIYERRMAGTEMHMFWQRYL